MSKPLQRTNNRASLAHRRMRRSSGPAGNRSGAIVTIEMLFVLPMLMYVGLVLVQLQMITIARARVVNAALNAAESASNADSINIIHREAGFILGRLGGEYQTDVEYSDDDGDGIAEEDDDDYVVVAVRIPMGVAWNNYLGWAGGGEVNQLHIRSVVHRTMKQDFTFP